MFGPHDDQYQQQDNNAQPQADGTLGTPADDNGMVSSDSGMPPFEQTAVPQAPDMSSARAMNVHTPEELISIKQEALQSLRPLVGHLQQSAEEKFRTTMMMIQAADDQSLIPEAYEAAKAIGDEKARAQALLDVVNEINYFTSQHAQQ